SYKPSVTGDGESVPVEARSDPAGLSVGAQRGLVVSRVAVGLLKKPVPARNDEHSASARIESHREEVNGRLTTLVTRDRAIARDDSSVTYSADRIPPPNPPSIFSAKRRAWRLSWMEVNTDFQSNETITRSGRSSLPPLASRCCGFGTRISDARLKQFGTRSSA